MRMTPCHPDGTSYTVGCAGVPQCGVLNCINIDVAAGERVSGMEQDGVLAGVVGVVLQTCQSATCMRSCNDWFYRYNVAYFVFGGSSSYRVQFVLQVTSLHMSTDAGGSQRGGNGAFLGIFDLETTLPNGVTQRLNHEGTGTWFNADVGSGLVCGFQSQSGSNGKAPIADHG